MGSRKRIVRIKVIDPRKDFKATRFQQLVALGYSKEDAKRLQHLSNDEIKTISGLLCTSSSQARLQ